ncbi:putative Orn arg lys decarboxylase [Entamoeba marina]
MNSAPEPRMIDEDTFVREITATDHINKSLAEAYLKKVQAGEVSFDSYSESEDWDDESEEVQDEKEKEES